MDNEFRVGYVAAYSLDGEMVCRKCFEAKASIPNDVRSIIGYWVRGPAGVDHTDLLIGCQCDLCGKEFLREDE